MVEHVSGGEEQDGDQREGSPEVAVLEEGQNVGIGNGDDSDSSEDSGGDGDDLHPVDRTRDLGLGNIAGELAGDPAVDLFGGLGTTTC